MSDLKLEDISQMLTDFRDERDWSQFHTPKNLVTALGVEAAELAEIFQWLTPEQSDNLTLEQYEQAKFEMADILNYLLLLANRLDVDLLDAAKEKIALNAKKYPAAKSKGNSAKYTAYCEATSQTDSK